MRVRIRAPRRNVSMRRTLRRGARGFAAMKWREGNAKTEGAVHVAYTSRIANETSTNAVGYGKPDEAQPEYAESAAQSR